MRKSFTAEFKGKVALEAFKEEKTISQMSSEYGVHANRIGKWKKELQKQVSSIFSGKKDANHKSHQELIDNLYRNIGELKVEDWLKKKLNLLM